MIRLFIKSKNTQKYHGEYPKPQPEHIRLSIGTTYIHHVKPPDENPNHRQIQKQEPQPVFIQQGTQHIFRPHRNPRIPSGFSCFPKHTILAYRKNNIQHNRCNQHQHDKKHQQTPQQFKKRFQCIHFGKIIICRNIQQHTSYNNTAFLISSYQQHTSHNKTAFLISSYQKGCRIQSFCFRFSTINHAGHRTCRFCRKLLNNNLCLKQHPDNVLLNPKQHLVK